MNIDMRQMTGSPKRIGRTTDGEDVFEMVTKGGLTVIQAAHPKSGAKRTLGLGPHRALARWVAKSQNKGIELTELSKSEAVGPDHWAHLIPDCLSLLARFQAKR